MREKYYMPPEQLRRLEATSIKGTNLNMAVKGLEFGSLSSTLLYIHHQLRAVTKAYQTILIMNPGCKVQILI